MRKGMEMPLVLVVGAVVLIVISLIVISITSGGLTKFFGTTTATQKTAGEGVSTAVGGAMKQICDTKGGRWDATKGECTLPGGIKTGTGASGGTGTSGTGTQARQSGAQSTTAGSVTKRGACSRSEDCVSGLICTEGDIIHDGKKCYRSAAEYDTIEKVGM